MDGNFFKSDKMTVRLRAGQMRALTCNTCGVQQPRLDALKLESLFEVVLIDAEVLCAPVQKNGTVLFPFDPAQHDAVQISGTPVDNIVSSILTELVNLPFIIFSGNPSRPLLLRCDKFSYNVLDSLRPQMEQTPIVISDDSYSWCACFHFELCCSFISTKRIEVTHEFNHWKDHINAFFVKEFVTPIPGNEYHRDLINRFFVRRISNHKEIK